MPVTFGIVAALSGMVYALLYRVPVRWRTPLALAGAVVMGIAVLWIILSTQEWLYEDTFCPPPWRHR
ncbi:hypothetical protein, partial [Mycolicibacterium sp. CBMA 295]|uniref:hypothetical protein n=1 Tax=Mycolicibacterium sp. CBMA 295 TaxID=2606605 RepID=UPI001EE4CA99